MNQKGLFYLRWNLQFQPFNLPLAEYLNWPLMRILNGFNYMEETLIMRFWQL